MKKLLGSFFTLVIIITTVFASVVSYQCENVEEENKNCIYFMAPSGDNGWGNFDTVYCHIWIDGGDEFFTWQTNPEKCENVKGNLWKYDLTKLKGSRRTPNGFDKKTTYGVVFSDNIGNQTYDLYFTKDCIGDTVECTSAYRGNPVDVSKKCVVAKWKINGDKYDSVEYTKETETTIGESNSLGESSNSLNQDMSMVIILILSIVIILLVIFMIVKVILKKR